MPAHDNAVITPYTMKRCYFDNTTVGNAIFAPDGRFIGAIVCHPKSIARWIRRPLSNAEKRKLLADFGQPLKETPAHAAP